MVQRGHHFLQIPGPTNMHERVLRAIAHPTIDHRGRAFQRLGQEVLENLKQIFKTRQPVFIYPASGTGARQTALATTLSPGARVLAFETGHFATLRRHMAKNIGLNVEFVYGDWRQGIDPQAVEDRLAADHAHTIRAVMAVHNETSTGVTSRIAVIRKALDLTYHPALFGGDTIPSLASIDHRHGEWGVDVTVTGSQKGLMLPPGLSFNAVSARALAAAKRAKMPPRTGAGRDAHCEQHRLFGGCIDCGN